MGSSSSSLGALFPLLDLYNTILLYGVVRYSRSINRTPLGGFSGDHILWGKEGIWDRQPQTTGMGE